MKRVPLEIAKKLKEIGYPQGWKCDKHYCLESEGEYGYQIGDLVTAGAVHKNCLEAVSAPTYIEVWLWLWKEKKISVSILCDEDSRLEKQWYTVAEKLTGEIGAFTDEVFFSDPEEAIIIAINYLVDNNLI